MNRVGDSFVSGDALDFGLESAGGISGSSAGGAGSPSGKSRSPRVASTKRRDRHTMVLLPVFSLNRSRPRSASTRPEENVMVIGMTTIDRFQDCSKGVGRFWLTCAEINVPYRL